MKSNHSVLALLVAALAAFCANAHHKTVRVFIFAGQSNMFGSDSKAKGIKLIPSGKQHCPGQA